MRFLIVADFSLQQRGKYTESFLIIKGFEKKTRLSQDFFIMQCGRDESRPYNMFLKKHALYSYRNCEDAAAYIKITLQ